MLNDKIFSVYMHKNKINGKVYIGATSMKPETRWNKGKGYVKSTKFYADIVKYGWDNFEHTIIIDNLDQEQSQVLERYYISKYRDNCYNRTVGGEVRHIKPRIKKEETSKSKCNKRYYEKNKERIKQRVMENQKDKSEKYNEYKRIYYQQNESYRQRKVEYQRKYREKKKLELSL